VCLLLLVYCYICLCLFPLQPLTFLSLSLSLSLSHPWSILVPNLSEQRWMMMDSVKKTFSVLLPIVEVCSLYIFFFLCIPFLYCVLCYKPPKFHTNLTPFISFLLLHSPLLSSPLVPSPLSLCYYYYYYYRYW
jgi:hypothetical protein